MLRSPQGEVSVTGTSVYTAPVGKNSIVTMMRFTNDLAYVLTVSKTKITAGIPTEDVIYELTLSAGDTVTDTFEYLLAPNEELKVISSITGTTYIVNIREV